MVRVLFRVLDGEVVCSDIQPDGVSFGTAIEDELGRPLSSDARIVTVDMDLDEAARLFRQPLIERYIHPIHAGQDTRKIARHRFVFDPTLLGTSKRNEWERGTSRKITMTETEMRTATVDHPLAEGKTLREWEPRTRG